MDDMVIVLAAGTGLLLFGLGFCAVVVWAVVAAIRYKGGGDR